MTLTEFLLARVDESEASARPGLLGLIARREAAWCRRQIEAYQEDPFGGNGMPTIAVRILAGRYANHPDFSGDWQAGGL